MGFTEKEQYLLDQLKQGNYGWAKYAASVEAQGTVSPKQLTTMVKMLHRLRGQQANHKRRYCVEGAEPSDLSDQEAMSLGEYF